VELYLISAPVVSNSSGLALFAPPDLISTVVKMPSPVVAFGLIAIVYFVVRWINKTDVAKIKNLPEIPGVPLFGNLLQLGDSHAKVAKQWAKQYGPVFQTRLGNKVRGTTSHIVGGADRPIESCVRQQLRLY